MMTRDQLIQRIKQSAYLEGEFTLRSGKKSTYYLDKYRFETQPDILAALGHEFAKHVTPRTTLIAGAELGGVALAAAAALAARLPFVIVRNSKKNYGTGNLFEGVIQPADCVLLVEDIATTGGQILEAAGAIRTLGATVEKIVAVIDRLEGAAQNIQAAQIPFHALFTRNDLGIVP